jgi:hypothetical protein
MSGVVGSDIRSSKLSVLSFQRSVGLSLPLHRAYRKNAFGCQSGLGGEWRRKEEKKDRNAEFTERRAQRAKRKKEKR